MSATMAVQASPVSGGSTVAGYLGALLAPRPQLSARPVWPVGLRGDVVDAPLDGCGGVIAHLVNAGVEICPIAQVGDRMLFLVAEGEGPATGLPPGVLVRRTADRLAGDSRTGDASGCWIVPPGCADSSLPSAEAVLRALAAARFEYQTALNLVRSTWLPAAT